MSYISTKELSERWRISESRIVRLAKEGRITGARLVGKSWVFPPDTEKPADNRRKENRTKSLDVFRFPLYLYANYSDDEIKHSFTADERTLYEGERLFFNGEYQKCHDLLNALAESTADRYVRFGALYHLCLASVYLRRCGHAFYLYNEIQTLFKSETAHRNEIGYIVRNLDTYFVGNDHYIESFSMDLEASYPPCMREYLLLECAYSDMLKAQYKSIPVDPLPYELVLQNYGDRFSPLSLLTMHLYVGSICGICGQTDRSVYHIRECCRIAREYNLEYSSVAFMSKYMQSIYKEAFKEREPDQFIRLKDISDEMFQAFCGLFEFIGISSPLHILNQDDSLLISYALKEMTNKEIASVLHLSMNTVSKRYSLLLEKTGTHSKAELAAWYLKIIRDYESASGAERS